MLFPQVLFHKKISVMDGEVNSREGPFGLGLSHMSHVLSQAIKFNIFERFLYLHTTQIFQVSNKFPHTNRRCVTGLFISL